MAEHEDARVDNAAMEYGRLISDLVRTLAVTQAEGIARAADGLTSVVQSGGVIHVFGTGHSHMIAEEVFTRAGGLAAINAVLLSSLMLHESALGSGAMEQLAGLGELAAAQSGMREGDGAIVVSNAGINDVPVQFALEAQHRGLFVVGITSLSYSRTLLSRHRDGRYLHEVVDEVLDNLTPPGDVALQLGGDSRWPVGPVSTVTGCVLVNSVMVAIAERLRAAGTAEAPILISSKIAGAEEHNRRVTGRYAHRVAHL